MAIVPPEILDIILAYYFLGSKGFAAIESLSLASRQLRALALRRYFSELCIHTPRSWLRITHIAEIFNFARVLYATTNTLTAKPGALAHFVNLHTLELDFSSDGLSTQSTRLRMLFGRASDHGPEWRLKRLKLTSLPRINNSILVLLAARFPALASLSLSCTERLDETCCWLCLEESASCAIHSPIPDLFPTSEHLAASVARALRPLDALTDLFLGVFLSHADVLQQHLERCASVVIPSPRTGYNLTPPIGPDRCAVCIGVHGHEGRETEIRTSALIARALPGLENIGWSSWFANASDGSVDVVVPGQERSVWFSIERAGDGPTLRRWRYECVPAS